MPSGNLTAAERLAAQDLAQELVSSRGHLPRGASARLANLIGRCAWPTRSVHVSFDGTNSFSQWEVAGPYRIACDGKSEMHIIHWREAGINGNGSMAVLRRIRGSWVLFAIEPNILEIPIWFNRVLRIGYSKEVERAREESRSR